MKLVLKCAFVAVLCSGLLLSAAAQETNQSSDQGFSSSKKSSKVAKANVLPEGTANAGEDANSTAARTTATATPSPSDQPNDPSEVYRVGVEDDLQISVWREPELSVQVVVRPDGMITMPLLNDIKVTGLTTKELQQLLIEQLKAYVTEPQVTVIVRGIRSRKVYLMGPGMAHPGAFSLNSRKTVLQMLAEVGGLGPFAKDKLYVLRTEANGETKRIPFSYKKALKGDMKDDVVLEPGDVIVAP